jgi:hypothetical protein
MRGWLAAVGVAATCALAGCSDDGGGTATPTPRATGGSATTAGTTPGATTTTAAGDVQRFVVVVRHELPDVAAGRTDAELTAVAATACEGLATGAGADNVTADAQSLGTLDAAATDPATARELVKLAIDTVCPDQAARVDEF